MKKFLLLFAMIGAVVSVHAKFVTKTVSYEHDGVKLEGYLAYDETLITPQKPAPGVLIIPEWWGLTDYPKTRAHKIASLGYVAFVADMYGAGQTTTDKAKAQELASKFYGSPLMASRATAGLWQMLKTGLVDSTRTAAIGYCFGGSTVQALAFSGAPLAGVASFHGSLLPVPADAAKTVKAKILVCHGAIDPFIKKEEIDGFIKGLDTAKLDYQFISYSGAVHAFTNPEANKLGAANDIPIAYNAAADARSWAHLEAFFNEIFAVKK